MSTRQMNLFEELVIDNFAGGGGASSGIEAAIGRPVDIAINHDPEAIAMHIANHPFTKHFCEDVWKVDPAEATKGKPIALVWLSPDCKHFSKAKGGKPVEKKIRGLAWVALRWAALPNKPRVIILENVEEFTTWGPLGPDGLPCKKRKGQTFRAFVNALKRQGYNVEWRELKACDFGTPTSRKRLFLIARSDGQPIIWPEQTHFQKPAKGQHSWRTAAECIDWSIPVQSIFEREKPLAEATLRRIARGIQKYVINAKEPFIVTCNHSGEGFRGQGIGEPMRTLTAARDAHGLVIPTLIQTSWGERPGQEPRVPGLEKPLGTVMAGGIKHALAVASLMHYRDQPGDSRNTELKSPLSTVTAQGVCHSMISASLIKHFGGNYKGDNCDLERPMHTVTAKDHHSLVYAFLTKYFGKGIGGGLNEPSATLTTKDRLAIVTIESIDYVIADIGMRMLQPHELAAAQGFPSDYIIAAPRPNGKLLSKTAQVRMIGNSVCPPVAEAIVRANLVQADFSTSRSKKQKRA